MNPAHLRKFTATLSVCAIAGVSVMAQGAATTPAETRQQQPEVEVVLAPFEVVADARDSYEALNFSSLSGTNRPLNRLPITAEVMGSALIADLGVTDALSLLNQYATGVGVGLASAGSPTLSGFLGGDRAASGATRLRGLASSGIRRNGFLNAGSLVDLYSMERTEVIRGPQSLLYGQGQAGGVTNLVTKKALFGRSFARAQLRADSVGSLRGQLDANISSPVAGKRTALGFQAMADEGRYWRDLVTKDLTGVHGEAAVEVFPTSATTVRVEWERVTRESLDPRPGITVSGVAGVPSATAISILLANHDPALERIVGGRLSWNNIDSLSGSSNGTITTERALSATASSRLAPWLQGQVMAMNSNNDTEQFTPNGFTHLRPARTSGNPLDTWGVGYYPTLIAVESRSRGVRGLLTADFAPLRRTKASVVLGAETRRTESTSFTERFYEVNANGDFLVTAAQANNADAGRNLTPVQWVNVESDMRGFVDMAQREYVFSGRTYRRARQKLPNPAFVAPGNPYGFNGGPAGASLTETAGDALFAVLFTSWLDGRIDTLVGARRDWVSSRNLTIGAPALKGADYSGNAGLVWSATKHLSRYVSASSNFSPSSGLLDVKGAPLPNGRGEGREAGLKFSFFEGRLSGSATRFWAKSRNESEVVSANVRDVTDPLSSVNGRYYTAFSPAINYDRHSDGYELTLTAQPTRNWRLQAGVSRTEGREGSAVFLPFFYNDEFRTNAQGQVTLADGTPLRVPLDPNIPVATDGRSYAASVATQVITVDMMRNGDAAGNYRASLDPENGRIRNPGALGLLVPGVGTGRTGLPIAQHQLGFRPTAGEALEARRGGDRTTGYPRQSFTFTGTHTFTRGRLKGLMLGANVTYTSGYMLYYYLNAASANARQEYYLPNRTLFNLMTGYEFKLTRRVTWKMQLNVNNAIARDEVRYLPNLANGQIANASKFYDPRLFVWTNTFEF